MKKMLVAAAFAAATVGLASPAVDAYSRGIAPVVYFTNCDTISDVITVSWNSAAGKPAYALFSYTSDGVAYENYLKIPGSRGSKGYWSVQVPVNLVVGDPVRVDLVNAWGTGYDTSNTVCP